MIIDTLNKIVKKNEFISVVDSFDDTNHPELKYHQELFELFYDIISDDSHSLETSIVLGAVAAQGLTKIVNLGRYSEIPDYIRDIKKQLNDPDQIKKIEGSEPNTEFRLSFADALNKVIFKLNIMGVIEEEGKISIKKFLEGERKFGEAYADRPFALRNIALNLLMEIKVPFHDISAGIYENYCFFAVAVAAIKFVAASLYVAEKNQDAGFKKLSAFVSRKFAHDHAVKVKKVMELLDLGHCSSPGNLVLILK